MPTLLRARPLFGGFFFASSGFSLFYVFGGWCLILRRLRVVIALYSRTLSISLKATFLFLRHMPNSVMPVSRKPFLEQKINTSRRV